MTQTFVNEAVYKEHSRMCDERFRRDKADIEKHEADISEIKQLTIEIAALVKKNDDTLERHELRLGNLEKKPSLWMERIISAGISTLVAAVVAAILSGGIS